MLKLSIIATMAFAQELIEDLEDKVWTFQVKKASPAPFRAGINMKQGESIITAASFGAYNGF